MALRMSQSWMFTFASILRDNISFKFLFFGSSGCNCLYDLSTDGGSSYTYNTVGYCVIYLQ